MLLASRRDDANSRRSDSSSSSLPTSLKSTSMLVKISMPGIAAPFRAIQARDPLFSIAPSNLRLPWPPAQEWLFQTCREPTHVRIPWLDAAAPKAIGSLDRSKPLEETASLIPTLRKRFGITRVGDTTHLDRIGIPTTCAVVPDSPDAISVYNGKGPTKLHSLCSAVMEAVERQSGASRTLDTVLLKPSETVDSLDFHAMGMLPQAFEKSIPFVRGVDILRRIEIVVPFAAVRCPWDGERVFAMSTTHGLASGNTLLEAVYHALFEYVERHGWAICHTRAHTKPRLVLEGLAKAAELTFSADEMVDDPAVTQVRLPTGDPRVDGLVEAIQRVGLTLRLTALAEGPLPVVMMASIAEPGVQPVMCHLGLGASWSPAHAAIRAITEAVQTRSVDIQGSREDLLRPGEESNVFSHHGRRWAKTPRGRWFFDAPLPQIAFDSIPDRSQACLASEVRSLLASLEAIGVRQVGVVDLSPEGLPVAVARVIVPDLESTMADGHVGRTIRDILSA